jgi:hypothetical protein
MPLRLALFCPSPACCQVDSRGIRKRRAQANSSQSLQSRNSARATQAVQSIEFILSQTILGPRPAVPVRRRAGQSPSTNCQRTSALCLHSEFTTGSPDSCGLIRSSFSLAETCGPGRCVERRVAQGVWKLVILGENDRHGRVGQALNRETIGNLGSMSTLAPTLPDQVPRQFSSIWLRHRFRRSCIGRDEGDCRGLPLRLRHRQDVPGGPVLLSVLARGCVAKAF